MTRSVVIESSAIVSCAIVSSAIVSCAIPCRASLAIASRAIVSSAIVSSAIVSSAIVSNATVSSAIVSSVMGSCPLPSPAAWTAVHHCVGSPGTVGVARPSTCRSQGASSGCGMSGGARYLPSVINQTQSDAIRCNQTYSSPDRDVPGVAGGCGMSGGAHYQFFRPAARPSHEKP